MIKISSPFSKKIKRQSLSSKIVSIVLGAAFLSLPTAIEAKTAKKEQTKRTGSIKALPGKPEGITKAQEKGVIKVLGVCQKDVGSFEKKVDNFNRINLKAEKATLKNLKKIKKEASKKLKKAKKAKDASEIKNIEKFINALDRNIENKKTVISNFKANKKALSNIMKDTSKIKLADKKIKGLLKSSPKKALKEINEHSSNCGRFMGGMIKFVDWAKTGKAEPGYERVFKNMQKDNKK